MQAAYDARFYRGQELGSRASARIVVPLVLQLFSVRSVVDIGCGVGGWLSAFEENGVTEYLGIDGGYIEQDMLQIPAERFRALDLTTLPAIGGRFDLACSLEVGEHLPEDCAGWLVSTLVGAAPVVLFSAALPGQGGTGHVNEQWPSYWQHLFARHGYVAVDCIRPLIHSDERIEFWYRQNTLVFSAPSHCPSGHLPATTEYALNRIHPELLELVRMGPASGKAASRAIMQNLTVIGQALLRKVRMRRPESVPSSSRYRIKMVDR
jgi:SAM-dependent methyltransferase